MQKSTNFFASLLVLFFACGSLQAQSAFINEINYLVTNPTQAGFEIAGQAGEDLEGWTAVLYSAQGVVKTVESLSGRVIPGQQNGYGTIWYDIDQTTGGDGIALVNPANAVTQFVSFGGSPAGFVAQEGPAAGMTSDYIGTQLLPGLSPGKTGTGLSDLDFSWALLALSSPGSVNLDQFFGMLAVQNNTQPQGFAAATAQMSLRTFPNPVVTTATLQFNQPLPVAAQLRVFDAMGRQVVQRTLAVEQTQAALDLQPYAPGTYFVQVQIGDTQLQQTLLK